MRARKPFRVFDVEFNRLFAEGVEAVDAARFSEAWESARAWRQMAIVWLVRKALRSIATGTAFEVTIERFTNFTMKFFGPRYITFSYDVLSLALAAHQGSEEKIKSILEIAKLSPYCTKVSLDAACTGLSGIHYYRPDGSSLVDISTSSESI